MRLRLVLISARGQALRTIFHSVIVDAKMDGLGQESEFEFKYIPDFDVTTKEEKYESRFNEHGVERRNLRALLYAGFATSVGIWLGSRIISWAVIKA